MRRRLSVLVIVAALLAVACGGNAEDQAASPSPAGSPPQAQVSRENKLPEGWPQDFPLPDQRKVVFSQSAPQSKLALFEAPQSTEELRAFFKERIPASGWTIQTCQAVESPQPILVIFARKGDQLATVSVGKLPGSTGGFEGDYDFFVTILQSPAGTGPTPAATSCP